MDFKSWQDFRAYEEPRESGTCVEGYRIHYYTPDGKIYSPFMRPLSFIDSGHRDDALEISAEGVNHSVTEHGYYYWTRKEAAENYLNFLQERLTEPYKGKLIIDKVRGIEKERNVREGNIMEDMQIVQEEKIDEC